MRRARDAGAEFRATITQVLRCITGDGLFVVPGLAVAGRRSQVLTFHSDRAWLRDRRGGRLFLSIEHEYYVDASGPGEPRVVTRGYIYTIYNA
jgi:hypothetical protein